MLTEAHAGNHQRAAKHFILAASAGNEESVDSVKYGYMKGYLTKEQYANTLRAYQNSQDKMKSDRRDKAKRVREVMDNIDDHHI